MRNRAGLVLLTILLVVVTGAATIFWLVASDLTAQAADEQLDDLVTQTESVAISAIEESMADIGRVTSSVSLLAARGAHNEPTAEWAMYQALEFVPELSGVYVAGPDGSFHYVFRTGDGFGTKWIRPEAPTPNERVTFTERDGEFNETARWSEPDDNFDPRTRGWYQAALNSPGKGTWTDPYTFFTSGKPGITHTKSSPDGSWVVGADVELASLVELLRGLSATTAGEVFLYDGETTVLSRNGLTELNGATLGSEHARVQSAVGALTLTQRDSAPERGNYENFGQAHTVSAVRVDLDVREWFQITDISADDVPVPIAGLVRGLQALALAMAAAAVLAIIAITIPASKPIDRLEQQANVDPLTSLPNRRAILQSGEARVMSRAPLTVAMVDIDKFKRVNDTYGHAVGDEVLRGLADRLLADGCEIGRLGGEEFVILVASEGLVRDTIVIESLRANVAAEAINTSAGPISITVSVGMAQHKPDEPFTTTLGRADGALFEAKLSGRNQVTAALDEGANVVLDDDHVRTALHLFSS